MTDGLDQALATSALTLLAADTSLTSYDGAVPNGAVVPYALVYTTVSRPAEDEDNTGDGKTRAWLARWIVHCVGANASAARAVAQRVRTQLLDVRPVIAGLACGLIRLEDSQPPVRDETTGTLVMDLVVTYRLKATN